MKILHITDSHGTVKSPESRTDIYYLSFLKKMYELGYVIKKENIKLIIHTGDMFHSARVSDKFTGQLAEIIKSYGIPMYVIPGNHDIDGYSINTLDQTKLGLLYKTGVVKELDRNIVPIQLFSQKENLRITISGQEYYKDIDTGNMQDFEMQSSLQSDFNILGIHGYLCDKPQNPNIPHTLCQNIVTDADVILSGHFHESFSYNGPDFSVYNPGSLMRVEQTEYNRKHLPQYGILEVVKNNGIVSHTYTMKSFMVAEPSEKVFDYNAKAQRKTTLITLDNFKNSIANTNLNNNLSVSIENIISDVANNLCVTQDIIDKTVDIYHDALNNSPDDLEVQQGFISSNYRKIIKSVEINNFQSHENTLINFTDGLNVIVGESNCGKTSILRAIRWALDNDPHGSDFITTGQDECEVTVIFDDGTLIKRKRTRDDAGTYYVVGRIIQPDGTESYWNSTYKGFANNLPVEISNIHQMPKINLTKDICTHLNMMSQLDGPFLVTDSPQVKATIIGRLTGTQIIDLAIKDTNKKILGNSKTIKVYAKEKQDKENEILKYNDLVYHEQVLKYMKCLSDYIDNSLEHITKVKDAHKEAISKELSIFNYCSDLKNIDSEIIFKSTLLSICIHIKYIQNIFDKKNYITVNRETIKEKEKLIKWLSIITSLKPFVETKLTDISFNLLIVQKYNQIGCLSDNIRKYSEFANNTNNSSENVELTLKSIKDIYTYCSVLKKDIDNTVPIYSKYISLKSLINESNGTLSIINDDISKISDSIKELELQTETLIKENNICPCCGQKITANKYIKNISNFMKGR